jgi:hypothetical protein
MIPRLVFLAFGLHLHANVARCGSRPFETLAMAPETPWLIQETDLDGPASSPHRPRACGGKGADGLKKEILSSQ